MAYNILVPGQGFARPGLGQGGRARLKAYARFKGKRRGYTRQLMRRVRSGKGFIRTAGFYGRFQGDGQELKFFDTPLSFLFDLTAECSTSAGTGNIHIVPTGVGQSQREGRRIVIKSIHLKGSMILNPGGAATSSTGVYLNIHLDTQCNGANPAITNVFTTADLTSTFPNLENSARFRTLKSFRWNFTPSAGVGAALNSVTKSMDWYKRCNIPIVYDSTAATGSVATTRSNNIFFSFGSDQNSDDLVTFAGACRIRYSE